MLLPPEHGTSAVTARTSPPSRRVFTHKPLQRELEGSEVLRPGVFAQ